jgi:uncharacterized phage protein (TIGR02220 family)
MTSRDFNPKDGEFTQVMNQFIKALCSYRLDSNEWAFIMLIIRYSWGMDGKAWAPLRWRFVMEKTKLPDSSLIYARRKLMARNFIHTRKAGQITEYKINSKYETWIPAYQLEPIWNTKLGQPVEVNNLPQPIDLKQVNPLRELPQPVEVTSSRKKDIKERDKETPIVPAAKNPEILTKKQIIEQDARMVIDYLNELSGKGFKHSPTSLEKIRARLNDGFTIQQCFDVCFKKWMDPDHKEKYYRPITLFRPGLFESYVNEKGTKRKPTADREEKRMAKWYRRYQKYGKDPDSKN